MSVLSWVSGRWWGSIYDDPEPEVPTWGPSAFCLFACPNRQILLCFTTFITQSRSITTFSALGYTVRVVLPAPVP